MKMLKEEKELRKWWASIEFPHENKRDFFKDIRAFEKAVREDERERCKLDVPHPPKIAATIQMGSRDPSSRSNYGRSRGHGTDHGAGGQR
jgi:hypothetical protein